MKILVTGGAGYIGSVLVPQLLQKGNEVIVVDSFIYGQQSLLDCCHHKNFSVFRHDVRDEAFMRDLLKKADAILPLACIVGAPACDQRPIDAQTVNLDAVAMLIRNASPNQQIILPVTNSGYGVGTDGTYCTEESPLRPVSLYGKLKVDLENIALDSGRAISLRLATVFGISPRMRMDLLVNDFTYRAVTDRFVVLFEAHFKRNYLHVRDVAKVFIHALNNFDRMKRQAYNVGLSNANLSKKELCDEIRRQVPDFHVLESSIGKDPDQRNYVVSNEKIERTGYKPDVSLQEGIAELIKGYQILRRNQFSNV